MDKTQDLPIPSSWPGRLLYGYVAILMPIASFLITFQDGYYPDWQSGRICDYTQIMLWGTVSRYYYPFLAFSMVCMLLLLISPGFSKYFIIRLGMYTGIILSFQYSILLSISADFMLFYGFVAGGLLLPLGVIWLNKKFGLRKTKYVVAGLVFSYWLIYSTVTRNVFTPLVLCLIIMFATAPYWCLILSVLVSVRLIKKHEIHQQNHAICGIGILAWFLPFIGAWRIAVLKTLEIYPSLPPSPPSPPDCYIATVAAKGHPQFVKSIPVVIDNGSTAWINAQMRYLKCAEITYMAMFPGGHKILREIYDVLGMPLARIMTQPVLADLMYMILKPIEWSARIVMRVFLSDVDEAANKIYQNDVSA